MTLSALGIFSAAGAGGGDAPSDFQLISTTVLGSNQPSITFNVTGLGSTYRHLQLRMAARSTAATVAHTINARFNGDNATNYSLHRLTGTGSVTETAGNPSQDLVYAGLLAGGNATSGNFSGSVCDILDAFSTTKNKTTRAMTGISTTQISMYSGAWYNTAALTSIVLTLSSDNFATGSRFSLYGIRG